MGVNKNETEKNNKVFKDNVDKSSIGLDSNLAGLLCYLLGVFTGILFLLLEKESRFVRYHAIQSIIVSIGLFIVSFILTAIPLIGWAIGLILSPVFLIIWIILMVKAYQGKWFKFPIAGEMSMNQLKKSG